MEIFLETGRMLAQIEISYKIISKRLLSDNSVMKANTRDDDVFILDIKERELLETGRTDRDILRLKCNK